MYAEIEVSIEPTFRVRVPLDALSRGTGVPEERLRLDEHSRDGDEEAVADWVMDQDDGYSRYAYNICDHSRIISYRVKEEKK